MSTRDRVGKIFLANFWALTAALAACGSVTERPLGELPSAGAEQGSAGSTSANGGSSTATAGAAGSGLVGSSGSGACNPLTSITTPVTLNADDIIAAASDTDGTVYLMSGNTGPLRLFVGTSSVVTEKFSTGSAQGTLESGTFWEFQYDDAGTQVTVEVQQEASGLRMGVVKGDAPGKGFEVGSIGSVLTQIAAASAAAIPVTSAAKAHVEYSGSASDGTDIVVVAPDHFASYDSFRLFFGTASELDEATVKTVTRGLSIPSITRVDFTLPATGTDSTLTYQSDSTDATLTSGSSPNFTGIVGSSGSYVLPEGAVFRCKAD